MNINPGIDVLTENEIELLFNSIIAVIGDIGLKIENERILERLSDFGAKIDKSSKTVCFPRNMIEDLFSENKVDFGNETGIKIDSMAEIYEGYYLNPLSEQYEKWNLDSFLNYLKVVKQLEHIQDLHMLGCPVYGPVDLQPLYSRLLGWKYGFNVGGSIWDTNLCPSILKMCKIMAESYNKSVDNYFRGTVYLLSPLTLGRIEAEHFLYFYDHGLEVNIGRLSSVGATAPVTLAGAMVENLAEQIMIEFVWQAFHGKRPFSLGLSLSVLDMNTGSFQYGRPEVPLLNMAGAQFARYFGLKFHGQCGLTDAKLPGYESASQKLNSAIITALASGRGYIAAGLLSIDEVYSPIQLILDNEAINYYNRIKQGFTINDETIGLQEITSVGHGGNFLATDFTLKHFKKQLWQPEIWSKETFVSWKDQGQKSDIDRAKEKYISIIRGPEPESLITPELENKLIKVIEDVRN